MAGLGKVSIAIEAQMAGFESDMGRAARVAEKEFKKIERDGKAMEAKMREYGKQIGTALVTGVTAAATAAVLLARDLGTAAKEIERFSMLTGTSADTFQRWAAGAATVGIEQDKLADIFKDMQDRVGDFIQTGGGPLADFFENIAPKVGVTAQQFAKLSGPDALQLFASSLEKANLHQNDMTFFMEAVASDSTLLLPLLRDNGKAMTEYGDAAAATGAIMGRELLQASNDYNVAAREMSQVLDGLKNTIGMELLPRMTELLTVTNEYAGAGSGASTVAEGLGRAFDVVAGTAQGVAVGIRAITNTIAEAINQTQSWYEIVSNVATLGFAPGTVSGGVSKSNMGWANYADSMGQEWTAYKGALDRIYNGSPATRPPAGLSDLSDKPSMAPASWMAELSGASGPNAKERAAAARAAAAGKRMGGRSGGRSREALDFTKEDEAALERMIEIEGRANQQFESMAATLAGPLAEAQYQYQQNLAEITRLGQEAGRSQAEVSAVTAKETERYDKQAEALRAQAEPYAAMLADLEFERKLLGMTNVERATAIALRGADAASVVKYGEDLRDANQALQDSAEIADFGQQVKDGLADAFTDFVSGAKSAQDAFGSFADAIYARALQLVADRAVNALLGAFTGTQGAGGVESTGGFADLFSSFSGGGYFGGGRAMGGPVSGGNFYEVGENNRPEILRSRGKSYLIPGNDGAVMPMRGGAGGMTVQNSFVLQASRDTKTQTQIAAAVAFETGRAARRNG